MAAWADIRQRKIPNPLLAVFLTLFFLAANVDWFTVASAFLVISMLFCLALVSRGAFGMGDGKLLGVLALFAGWRRTWHTFAFGLLLAGAAGLGLLVLGEIKRKEALPLAPFFLAGYLASFWMG